MRSLKLLLTGLVLGGVVGLWQGINIGKNNPWYSNPLEERSVTDKIKSSIGDGFEKAGESIEKVGGDIKGKLKN